MRRDRRALLVGTLPVLLLLMVLLPASAWAQPALVRGFVTDASNGEPLQGASVVLRGGDDLLLGAATDGDGLYAIAQVPPGRYELRASFVGYRAYVDTLQLGPDDVQLVSIALQPTEEALDEVVVESDEEGGATALTAGLQPVRPDDIERVPAPGVAGDLASYLTALPGVVTSGDQGGQFFIRGGEPTQNLVLLDGMLIYQPFHVLSFYSSFPTDVIREADVYAGGFGARYGGRLSSVVDISSRNGNKQQYTGVATASPFVASAQVEGPVQRGTVSFLASVRQSLVEEGAAQYVDRDLPYRFGDVFVKLHGTPGRHHRLAVTGLHTYDRGTIGAAEEDVPGELAPVPRDVARWRNDALGVRYLVLPGSLPLLVEMQLSVSHLKNTFGDVDDPVRTSSVGRLNSQVHVTQYGRIEVGWGLFARTLRVDSDLGGLYQNVALEREFLTEAGLYVEPVLKRGSRWRLVPGLRVHAFPSKDQAFIEPRFRGTWQRGPHRVSAALGLYHQEIVGVSDRRDAASVFTAWTAVPFGDVPSAWHGILGYRAEVGRGLSAAIEGYHKRLRNLYVAEWTAFPRLTTNLQQADGRVWGLDARLEWRRPAFYGYVGYGLSSVEYEAQQDELALWFGESTLQYRPAHDRRHQVNVVATTTWRGIDLGFRWQFGSGLPYNRALGFDGFLLMDGAVDVFDERGDRRVIYERPFNGVLPTYHRLDLSIARTFPFRTADVTVQGTLINTYDRANIFYLDVFTLRRVDQLPLLPSVGLSVAFN